ncbi:MAG: ribose 5-phosphate isomerase B [Chloroflexi bacterium]|jgi:ribose 5-phosphate isomerase B|nr:MAG: ribose 5-phosphate isomerase B [Chloroflexota bacterium]
MMPHIALGADHGGLPLKQDLHPWLEAGGFTVLDVGAYEFNANDDYPDFAAAVARAVASGEVSKGIIVCGSGVGASVAANKIAGVRAGVCHDTYSAHQGVEHDDVNVLCLGSRVVGIELAKELVSAFLSATFTREDRHMRRLQKVLDLERQAQ